MDLNIRALAISDVMPVVTILNKLNIKDVLSAVDASKLSMKLLGEKMPAEERKKVMESDAEMLAMLFDQFVPVIGLVLNNIPACEGPLYSWLANMCGMKEKEFRALPPAVLPEALYEIVHQEGFVDFFKAASKFLQ